MSATAAAPLKALNPIARRSGALAMVAIDQRESLRMMMQAHQDAPVTDQAVTDFKITVAEVLGEEASAMLFDRRFGLPALSKAREKHSFCGRVLAVDALIQEPGQPVTDTELDTQVDFDLARSEGVTALKLLLLWKSGSNQTRCRELAEKFVNLCRREGFISIVEAMVRPADTQTLKWNREEAMLGAAAELGMVRPDLYKAEVPFHGEAPEEQIRNHCKLMTSLLPCPWVVLSQGVDPLQFPNAVRAACLGGASGFLAGRAIWSDSIGPGDCRGRLQVTALPRLSRLGNIVDAAARPWNSVR